MDTASQQVEALETMDEAGFFAKYEQRAGACMIKNYFDRKHVENIRNTPNIAHEGLWRRKLEGSQKDLAGEWSTCQRSCGKDQWPISQSNRSPWAHGTSLVLCPSVEVPQKTNRRRLPCYAASAVQSVTSSNQKTKTCQRKEEKKTPLFKNVPFCKEMNLPKRLFAKQPSWSWGRHETYQDFRYDKHQA